MSEAIVLTLPDEVAARYRRDALAARKPLDEFLVERLAETTALADDLPATLSYDLRRLDGLDDDHL